MKYINEMRKLVNYYLCSLILFSNCKIVPYAQINHFITHKMILLTVQSKGQHKNSKSLSSCQKGGSVDIRRLASCIPTAGS